MNYKCRGSYKFLFLASDQKERERQIMKSEMIPTERTYLSFWQKFRELQMKMLWQNSETVQNHMYSSDPLEWPLMSKGIAYWYQKETNVSLSLLKCFNLIFDVFRHKSICLETLQYGILAHSAFWCTLR